MKNLVLLCSFFALLHVASLLSLWALLPGGRTAYIVDAATLIPIAMGGRYLIHRQGTRGSRYTRLDWAVLAYCGISVTSALSYLQRDNPSDFEAYFYGVHLFVLPISLYFGVKMLTSEQQRQLLVWICWLNFMGLLFGFYLHFERPGYYRDYLVGNALLSKQFTEDWQIFSRMQSYLGSTVVGSIAAVSIILMAVCEVPHLVTAVMTLQMVTAAFLSQQRGGIVATILATLYTVFIQRRPIWVRALILVVALVGTLRIVGVISERDVEAPELWRERFSGSIKDDILYERGYKPGWQYFLEFPLGVGLGGTSSAADAMGLAQKGQVVDANFMRILADLGLQGLLAFSLILFLVARAAWRRQNGLGWLMLPGCIVVICIGTNTLDSHYVAHCFWAALGVIDSPDFARSEVLRLKVSSKPTRPGLVTTIGQSVKGSTLTGAEAKARGI